MRGDRANVQGDALRLVVQKTTAPRHYASEPQRVDGWRLGDRRRKALRFAQVVRDITGRTVARGHDGRRVPHRLDA
jgi:hypothetical protein